MNDGDEVKEHFKSGNNVTIAHDETARRSSVSQKDSATPNWWSVKQAESVTL